MWWSDKTENNSIINTFFFFLAFTEKKKYASVCFPCGAEKKKGILNYAAMFIIL